MKPLISSIIAFFALILISCNNESFFELKRPQQNPWNTVQEFEFAAVTPYKLMFHGGWGALYSNHALNQVVMSDYFRFLGNVEGYSTGQLYERRFNDRVTEVEDMYSKLYAVIGAANVGLEAFRSTNDNPFPFASSDDKEKNIKRIKGELLFMRAFAYYHLAVNFCPAYGYGDNNNVKVLVKRDKATFSSEDAIQNQPVTTAEIFDFIVADLKLAKELLPAAYTDGMHPSFESRARANKWAASSFLAQVYFTMRKFTGSESALTELDNVIANGGYTLETDLFKNYSNQEINPRRSVNNEVIMWAFYADNKLSPTIHNAIRYTHFSKNGRDAKNGGNGNTSSGTSPKWSNFHSWMQMVLGNIALVEMGWINADGSEPISAKFDKRYFNQGTDATQVNQFGLFYRYEGAFKDTADYRVATGVAKTLGRRKGASDDGKYIIDQKFSTLIGNNPIVLVNKHFRTNDGRLQNLPLIRLSELYLTRAMIKKQASIPGWAADYNVVARRAWNATVAGAPYVDKTDSEVTERMILVERWKELAGEDGWYVPFCMAAGIEIGQGDRTAANNAANIAAPYADAYWKNCIPLSELDFQKK